MILEEGWVVVITGILATAFQDVIALFRSLLTRLVSYVVEINRCETDLGWVVMTHLEKSMKRPELGVRLYDSMYLFVRPLDRIRRVVFHLYGRNDQVYWKGWRPMWITGRGPGGDSNEDADFPVTFTFIRGTFNWEEILKDALSTEDAVRGQDESAGKYRYIVHHVYGQEEDPNEIPPGSTRRTKDRDVDSSIRFQGRNPLWWTFEDLGPRQAINALDSLSLDAGLMAVVKEIQFWKQSQGWYKEKGIPWKRGYLFYGPPGTGKTSLTRALAEHLDLPVYVFDLPSMQNRDLIQGWTTMLSDAPCIALLEDIDSVFQGRKNVTSQGNVEGVTFDCLLNCIDGVERTDGLLTIVTTNKLEHLDDALGKPSGAEGSISTRPGRIDRAILFHPLDYNGRMKLAMRVVGDPDAAASLASHGEQDSAAQFQERCFRYALDLKFKSFKKE